MADPHGYNPDDDSAISRYLLGQADENERASVQELLLHDDDFFDRVKAVEQDLLDSYVRGELSPAERELVKSTLLAAPEGRREVAFARALAAVTNARTPQARTAIRPSQAWIGLVAAMVLVAAAVGYLAMEQRKQPAVATTAPTQAAPATPRKPVVFSVLLSPGALRGGEKIRQVAIPPGTDVAQLQLDLENDRHPSYSAVLKTVSGATVWEGSDLAPAPDGSVSCSVPATALKPASYELTLSAVKGAKPEVVGYYYFQVP